MNKAILILFATAAVFIVQATSIEVLNCVDGKFDDNLVDFPSCASLPCALMVNRDHDFNLFFTPTSTIDSLIVRARTKIQGGQWEPFVPFDGLDACNHIYRASDNKSVACPLESNVNYIFGKRGLMVTKNVPYNVSSGHYTIHWALEQNGYGVACFKIDILIEVSDPEISFTLIEYM